MPVPQSTQNKSSYHHGDLERSLLDAAEIVLEENGIEQFSLRAVAKRAAVSHGAPAHHFGNANGLLTALAARGYGKFIRMQDEREAMADQNPEAKLVASGLGYIDFATKHSALFRLMFASERTDKTDPALSVSANAAFEKLVAHIRAIRGSDPHEDQKAMADVLTCWGIVHGLADLTIADRLGRARFLEQMSHEQRDSFFSGIILRGIQSDGGDADE